MHPGVSFGGGPISFRSGSLPKPSSSNSQDVAKGDVGMRPQTSFVIPSGSKHPVNENVDNLVEVFEVCHDWNDSTTPRGHDRDK
jgi:hypothetical protein